MYKRTTGSSGPASNSAPIRPPEEQSRRWDADHRRPHIRIGGAASQQAPRTGATPDRCEKDIQQALTAALSSVRGFQRSGDIRHRLRNSAFLSLRCSNKECGPDSPPRCHTSAVSRPRPSRSGEHLIRNRARQRRFNSNCGQFLQGRFRGEVPIGPTDGSIARIHDNRPTKRSRIRDLGPGRGHRNATALIGIECPYKSQRSTGPIQPERVKQLVGDIVRRRTLMRKGNERSRLVAE
jgi:hypothetical protein